MISDNIISINGIIPSSSSGPNSGSGSDSLSLLSPFSLNSLPILSSSAKGMIVDERDCAEFLDEAIERVFFNFLNGRVITFALFCATFFRDATLPEITEDLAEELSADFAMVI